MKVNLTCLASLCINPNHEQAVVLLYCDATDQSRKAAGLGRPVRSRIINSKQPIAMPAIGRKNIQNSVEFVRWPNWVA